MIWRGREWSVDEAFTEALRLLSTGDFSDMAKLCREIVAVEPGHYRAHHGIGLGLHRSGQHEMALPHFDRALEINPEYFSAWLNLSNVLRSLGRHEDALAACERAINLNPEEAISYFNKGNLYSDLSRFDLAVESYGRGLEINPAYVLGYVGRAKALFQLGRHEESVSDYKRVFELEPENAEAAYSCAVSMLILGMDEEVKRWLHRALAIRPENHDALVALGNLLWIEASRGNYTSYSEAIDCYRRSGSDDADVHIRLGNMLLVAGKLDEALREYRWVADKYPKNQDAAHCLAMSLNYDDSAGYTELASAANAWWKIIEGDVSVNRIFDNERVASKKLRVGYVSADFKQHPVGFHFVPIIENHDAQQCEIYCYSNNEDEGASFDAYTLRIQSASNFWRNISKLSDDDVCALIKADQIDILVDLSGHTRGNRLPLFARHPAPVQVSWIGYFFSTGLPEMDYILMDEYSVLEGEERWFSERVVRLPVSRFCYEPPSFAPSVHLPPVLTRGYVTFGSFNNLVKLTPAVIRLWASILREVPDSRLILKSSWFQCADGLKDFGERFASEGIDAARIELRPDSNHAQMLAEYSDVDIALDPFPFNGGATTCEALWMGLPVVTLYGDRPISRQSSVFLTAIGLQGLVAKSTEEYLAIAKFWAGNMSGLARLRKELRGKMKNTLLCDGKKFTENLEKTYRFMWQEWLESGN